MSLGTVLDNQEILALVGRNESLFCADLEANEKHLRDAVAGARFLVLGGAGSIGQAVSREIFRRKPAALHLVDLSENNLVEVVRDIRSSLGYIEGDFQALPLDCGSAEYDAFVRSQKPYDFILNLSALKHVRSEKDPYTLMRMVRVNILNPDRIARQAAQAGTRKLFSVSTDKAANPVNMMGASKRIMEMFLMQASLTVPVSLARFANVAFSDGSLLHGFAQRIQKKQPLSAPTDVKRYFITLEESGQLCLLSCLLGENRDLFFPKLDSGLHLATFSGIAEEYLRMLGYEPVACPSEEEARAQMRELIPRGKWPCYFFTSDTTGEKEVEEFFTAREVLDLQRFRAVGIIKGGRSYDAEANERFRLEIGRMLESGSWTKEELLALFHELIPDFMHEEKNKYLDQRM
jgi:FlaA1/EpsC-like NDP-sugar epimerase